MNIIKKEINRLKKFKMFVKDLLLPRKYPEKSNYQYKGKIYGKKQR